MEKFEAVYAKLLIADNGTLGKFVFNGNYMLFSFTPVGSSVHPSGTKSSS
jgi:hypothetical protein